MFSDDILRRYIQSIDYEQALSMERVLPLYKYGFVLKREHYDALQIHEGFRKTIERYIENKETVTKKELLCILKYYSLEFPDIVPILPPEVLRILFVPEAQILLSDVIEIVNIDFVPEAQINININDIPVKIDFVPSAQVQLDSSLIFLSFVPQAQIELNLGQLISIVFIPQVQIELTDIPPIYPNIEFVPPAWVDVFQPGETQLEFIPEAQITLESPVIPTGSYFWGFTPYNNKGTRSSELAYMQTSGIINTMKNTTNYANVGFLQQGIIDSNTNLNNLLASNWDLNIPVGEIAYMVFLIPTNALARTSWQSQVSSGLIGGLLDESTLGNEFPSPDTTITYNGVSYFLYIGNRRRRYAGNYNLIRTDGISI
jgi:hypothetical protein